MGFQTYLSPPAREDGVLAAAGMGMTLGAAVALLVNQIFGSGDDLWVTALIGAAAGLVVGVALATVGRWPRLDLRPTEGEDRRLGWLGFLGLLGFIGFTSSPAFAFFSFLVFFRYFLRSRTQ